MRKRSFDSKRAPRFKVIKSDDEKRQVFGWASVSARVDGEIIEDFQEDIIEIDELEKAAYAFTKDYATAGEMHERGGVGELARQYKDIHASPLTPLAPGEYRAPSVPQNRMVSWRRHPER